MALNTDYFPIRTIQYRCYVDGGPHPKGITTIDLPDFDFISEEVKVAGMAGSVEVPTLAHLSPMEITLHWVTHNGNIWSALDNSKHQLELRIAQEDLDSTTNALVVVPEKITCWTLAKKVTMGSLEIATASDATSVFEITAIRIEENGEIVVDIDKLGQKCIINGEDLWADISAAID